MTTTLDNNYLYKARNATVVTPTQPAAQPESEASRAVAAAEMPETPASNELDLSFLDLPTQTAQAVTAASDTPAAPADMTDGELAKFKQQFKQVFGVDAEMAAQQFTAIEQFRQQQSAQQQLSTLEKVWSVPADEVNRRLGEVTARFNTYPADLKAKLDNVEGAQLIWAKLQQEKQAQTTTGKTPTLDRSSGNASGNVGKPRTIKQSDIDKLTPQEYAENADRISQAYAMGLVVK